MATQILEKHIQSAILKYLRSLPRCYVFKINQVGPYAHRGLPDIAGTLDGRSFYFEVKRPGGKATKLQLNELEEQRAAGAVAEVVRSVEDVKQIIESWCSTWQG